MAAKEIAPATICLNGSGQLITAVAAPENIVKIATCRALPWIYPP
jgi:hypothetical protein